MNEDERGGGPSPPSEAPADEAGRAPDAGREPPAGGAPPPAGPAKSRPDPTRYGDWEKDGRCIDF
jgi:hypothetical protein